MRRMMCRFVKGQKQQERAPARGPPKGTDSMRYDRQSEKDARLARGEARGFTIIEVMIVLAIILLIAGLVAVNVFSQRDKADLSVARVQMESIQSALDQFRLDYRRYPTDEEGLAVLWDRELLDPDAETAKYPAGGYLQKPTPADVWGNAWGYRQESEEIDFDEEVIGVPPFDLWSNGPDGEEGTEDDITSWASAAGTDDEFGEDLLPPGGP